MDKFSITQARLKIGDLAKQAYYQKKSFTITSYGTDFAHIVPVDAVSYCPNEVVAGSGHSYFQEESKSEKPKQDAMVKEVREKIEKSVPEEPIHSMDGPSDKIREIIMKNKSVIAVDGPTEDEIKGA